MYRSLIFVTFLVLWTGIMHSQPVLSLVDESAIRNLVQQYMDARNSRNADATRSLFTSDADQLVSTGEWRRGIDALVRGAMASSQKESGKSSIRLEAIRLLAPTVAVADGRYETATTTTGVRREMWTTLVLNRTERGWRIAAIRNMLPAPAPSGALPGK